MIKRGANKTFDLAAKRKVEENFRYLLLGYTGFLVILGIILLSDYTDKKTGILLFLLAPLWVGAVIYFTYYYPYLRTIKWLRNKPELSSKR